MKLLKLSRRKGFFCSLVFCLVSLNQNAFGNDTFDDNGIIRTKQGFTITLSEESQQAINNGVPLTFLCEFAMQKKLGFITWNSEKYVHRFMVSRHALSNRYLVRLNNALKPKIFVTIGQTMKYISRTSEQLFGNYAARQSEYKMRLRLSKYELPGPIRLSAFMSSDWNLNTGWITWAYAE